MPTYEYIDYSENTFKVMIDSDLYTLTTPLSLNDTFKDKNFDIYFLTKKDVLENDIFQVYDEGLGSRIGWMIPINSLESNSHDYADNIHFQKYAYVGIVEALKNLNKEIYLTNTLPSDFSIQLSDIFHEFTVLLIISKETLPHESYFDINRATSSLIKYGYIKLSTRNPEQIFFKADSPQGEKLTIQQVSKDIYSYELISNLLIDFFTYEKNALFQFFFLYQIFELLIDEIYQTEQEKLVENIVDAFGDSGKTKHELDKLSEFLSEKTRLTKLINSYSQVTPTELDNLKNICNDFLKKIGRKEGEFFHAYFYPIRNFLFHQYRDYNQTLLEEKLQNIIKETVEILPTILYKYQIPSSNN